MKKCHAELLLDQYNQLLKRCEICESLLSDAKNEIEKLHGYAEYSHWYIKNILNEYEKGEN